MKYPFQSREYRDLFKKHFVTETSSCVSFRTVEYEILPDKRALLLGMKKVLNGQEITDYGDLEFPDISQIHSTLKEKWDVASVQYDYIREDCPGFETLKKIAEPTLQEVAPHIILPDSWDNYLERLERTDRKELKRKMKRLDTVEHRYDVAGYGQEENSFEQFIRLHKLSDPSKDAFMTPAMEAFFRELFALSIPGWQQKIATLTIEGKAASSLFYFENDTSVLLYNSGFDPGKKFYSTGLLLTAWAIRQAILLHRSEFDFLRGKERYKYDLGGTDVRLYKFII